MSARRITGGLADPEPTEIGAWIQPDRNTGELFYFFGPVVQSTDFIPDDLEPLEVESADYAVFPVPPGNGNMTLLNENVRRMWKYIFGEWLPQNKNYRTAEGKIDLKSTTVAGPPLRSGQPVIVSALKTELNLCWNRIA